MGSVDNGGGLGRVVTVVGRRWFGDGLRRVVTVVGMWW